VDLISSAGRPYFSSTFVTTPRHERCFFIWMKNGMLLALHRGGPPVIVQIGPKAVGIMAGMVPIRIVSFLFLFTCTSLCQRPDADVKKASLPDAPSVQIPTQERSIQPYDGNSVEFDAVHFDYVRDLKFDASPEHADATESAAQSKNLFARYLYPSPSSLAHNGSFHTSTSDSLIGRATYAASSLVLTHDDEGNSRLNTSYLLRVLTSAVAHSAYRPYWKRHISQPFSDFGSTIGNDAGINVFHEFEPGILQLVKTHEPRFVSSIEEHFHHK
jgi:hypothetical protein